MIAISLRVIHYDCPTGFGTGYAQSPNWQISVRVLINRSGEVEQFCGTGESILRKAAAQWLFRVPGLNGEEIPYVEETLIFNFVLEEPPGGSTRD